MSPRTVSIPQAIEQGEKQIASPSRIILIATVALPVPLMVLAFSFWWLLLLPCGMFASIVYVAWATPRWQIWAYRNVNDIHQLQRSAELAGLLTRGSHERVSGWLGLRQQEQLRTLQERFKEEVGFIDDPAIPGRTAIYYKSYRNDDEPALALNSAGIWIGSHGLYDWDVITNERIAVVSYSRRSFAGTNSRPSGHRLFRFEVPDGQFEMPLATLNIEEWELDFLLYIYRGRCGLMPPLMLNN